MPDDETMTAGNVSVWEQSILPLRTDTSNADTQIDNAAWYIERPNSDFSSDSVSLNKDTIGVFKAGEEITVEFNGDYTSKSGSLAGEKLTIVAARVSPSPTTTYPSINSYEDVMEVIDTTSRDDVQDRATEEKLNRNVTFYEKSLLEINTDSLGTYTFTPPKSGEYVFFVANGEPANSGLKIDDKNLTVTGEPTIVGVERAMVHNQPSSASLSTSSPARGDTLTFKMNDISSMDGDNVQQAVLVYDEETGFEDQMFKLRVEGSPSTISELSESTTLKHSISEVNGVAHVEDGTTFFDKDVSRRNVGSYGVTSLMDFVKENTDRTIPETEAIHDSGAGDPTLDGSVTAVTGKDSTINVQTLTNWSSDTYRWVHVAVNEDGDIRTKTDTFDLEKSYIGVSNIQLPSKKPKAGKSFTVSAEIHNTGNEKLTNEDVWLEYRKEGSTDWNRITDEKVDLDADETKTVDLTGAIPKKGTYEIRVNGKIATDTLTVKAKDGGGGSNPGSPGGGGGAGGLEPPQSVETVQQSDGSAVADIRGGQAGDNVQISIPSKQATQVSGVSFESLNVKLKNGNAHFKFAINSFSSRPSSVPSDPSGVTVKGYLQVEKELISNADIEEATFRFGLSSSQLSEYSTPNNVVLYRYHDGSWQELETTFVGQENGQYKFEAVTPGFSVFAIGEKQPSISVSSAELGRSTVTVGETVDVTAELTNDGNGEGTYTAELTVDGDVVATKDVTVKGGETKTVTFNYEASETGKFEVSVDDASAGTLTVVEEGDAGSDSDGSDSDETTTSAGPDEEEDDDDGGIGALGISIAVLLILGLIGGGLYYFRDEVQMYLSS
ncbi:PGF-pre-PGF domain-containing protein [Halorussus salinus]|uniref:PGF-pre-PGF domain-containing protein n=1 Tax=Halorussus salinus TaxID=1364935 RepID=UPI00138F2314|nr:PGF-pre-PGF domain-containing protein [Halorussus salinus]